MKQTHQKQYERFIPLAAKEHLDKLEYPRKDDLYCILDLIYRKDYYYKSEKHKRHHWVQISTKAFKILIADSNALNKAKSFLIDQGIIEEHRSYSTNPENRFSKGYRICSEYLSVKTGVTIQNKNINKRIELSIEESKKFNDKRIEFAKTEYHKNFQIDYEAAYNKIYSVAATEIKSLCVGLAVSLNDEEVGAIIMSKPINGKGLLFYYKRKELTDILFRFGAYHHKILSIKAGYLYFNRNGSNGRLDSNLTSLPKILRPFIISKEPLSIIDVKNSQPYFLYTVLKEDNTGVINIHELERYRRLVVSGNFYEKIIEQFNAHGKHYTRAEIKTIICKIYYSKIKDFKNYKLIFAEMFPTIMKYISQTNSIKHNTLALILQGRESDILISSMLPTLKDQNIIPFTIHDSYVCKESEVNLIIESINSLFTNLYGCPPNLHVKPLLEEENEEEGYEEIEHNEWNEEFLNEINGAA